MIGRLTLLIAALSIPGAVQAKSYPPRNECARSAEAAAFQRALTTAVVNRNEDMLAGLVEPDILLDFGGGSGVVELRARLDNPDYRLWHELDQILRLGCAQSESGGLSMPHYWAHQPEDGDPYGLMLVTGERVPLYATQNGDDVVSHLSWEFVDLIAYDETVDGVENAERMEIRRRNDKRGYVAKDKLRSLIDYRLLAERDEAGHYRMTIFVAGD